MQSNLVAKNYFNIYIGNHGKISGIEDYIDVTKQILKKTGIPVRVTSSLDADAVNIIIDEFTNYVENLNFLNFKKNNPKSHVIFVLTEFVESKWGVKSINNFGGLLEASSIALFDVYLRFYRKDYPSITINSLLKLFCYLPVILTECGFYAINYLLRSLVGGRPRDPFKSYIKFHARSIYFHMRFLGLKTCLEYSNAILAGHEDIIAGVYRNLGAKIDGICYLGVLYPEFHVENTLAKLKNEKKLFIEMTGSITAYRKKWMSKIDRTLISLGMHNHFGLCKSFSSPGSETINDTGRAAFSMHPPQSRWWKYCSPMRIYRALAVDNNLPVATKNFSQNPIENICFLYKDKNSILDLYKMYIRPDQLRNFVDDRIQSYNDTVSIRNDALVKRLKSFIQSGV
jgi:hypothetical protein